MNKRVHRLVFDRRRNMRVPAAEHVRSAGKNGSGETRSMSPVAAACSILVTLGASLMFTGPTWAQQRTMAASVQRSASFANRAGFTNLPVRSTSATRLANDLGAFKINTVGQSMLIDQTDSQIIINWDSFNVGAGYTVQFNQPSTTSSALNNVWSGDPSVILGHIRSNGEVILQNRNGILFGPTARVDTGRFVATALSIAKDTFTKGLRAVQTSDAVFGSDSENQNASIVIERGAEIKAVAGGDVIMVAPTVYNEGRIETPSGQTILAAGQKVYLYANTSDTIQRGLLVAVDAFATNANSPANLNTVEQGAAGTYQVNAAGETVTGSSGVEGLTNKINQIVAEKGTINLVGMTVRQNGVLSATTAVKGQNGAIYLQAMSSSVGDPENKTHRTAGSLGTVDIGSGSVTSVTPDASAATQTSSEAFYRSRINIDGKDVRVRSGALIQAVSGNIQIRAAKTAGEADKSLFTGGSSDNSSTLVIDSGATLTGAGLRDVLLPMSRNQLEITPFQIELADSPVQRNGVIYRKDILADARRQVTIADVSGFYTQIGRTAQELSTRGGNIVLASKGSLVVSDGAKLDISGGSVRYTSGQIYSSILQDGNRLVSIEDADPNTRYSALLNPNQKTSTLASVASYAEGADAGSLSLVSGNYYFGGDLNASVVVGPLQRGGTTNAGYTFVYAGKTKSDNGSLLDDELGWSTTLKSQPWLYASLQPVAGTLSVGALLGNADTPAGLNVIHLTANAGGSPGVVPEVGSSAASTLFASLAGEVRLSTSALQAAQIGRLDLVSGSTITMDADANLNLGAKGIFTARSNSQISLSGKVFAEGGTVSLSSNLRNGEGVLLSPGAVIDVSGRVLDERKQQGSDAVSVDGGKITLSSSSSVDMQGATLDVSGGVWLVGSSKHLGSAGSLTLKANVVDSADTDDRNGRVLLGGASLSGYDFASGGTLSISGVNTLAIGVVPQSQQAAWSTGLTLSDDFFSNGGFGKFSLSALGDVEVFAGTHVNARMKNLYLPIKSRYLAGESAVASLQILALADALRSGVNISLASSSAIGVKPFMQGGSVNIDQGASIDTGAGGSISLSAGHRIDVAGALVAHGGQINMSISSAGRGNTQVNALTGATTGYYAGSENLTGYVQDREIRLTSTSVLDVSGTSKVVVNQATQRRTGSVLGGGTINLGSSSDVGNGSIYAEAGSVMNVSGAADMLDAGARVPTGVLVSKGAGAININTADGFVMAGTMIANRPNASVAGGTFTASVTLAGVGSNDVVSNLYGAKAYPTAAHQVTLLGTQQDVVNYTSGSQYALYGNGVVSTEQLLGAGFDVINLTADDKIVLGKGANFAAASGSTAQPLLRSLAFNTHVLEATDGQRHLIEAGRVAMGSDALTTIVSASKELSSIAATSGTSTLDVHAGLIEVDGYLGLSGFGVANLSATLSADQTNLGRTDGEIRLAGHAFSSTSSTSTAITGQLNFAGQLNLTAGNVYATTLSDYTIQGGTQSTLTIVAPSAGSTSSTPLTALAQLSLHANNITIDGTINQAYGQVSVTADDTLTVGEHARVSVSGDGQIVPVGGTINGTQWAYNTSGAQNGVASSSSAVISLVGADLVKSIGLNGKTISLDGKATLAAAAGGDLQASEFVPGVGGSVDELNKAGYFAILPGYTYDYAPYDTEIVASQKATGTKLTAGDQVRISTSNSLLATGTYTLLPARYALLPGAILVKASSLSAAKSSLQQASLQDDGSQLVSGYVSSAGTQLGSQTVGAALTLIPQATLKARSQYLLTSINDYETAKANGSSDVSTPGSAGRIQLASNNPFNVGAHFDLNGGGELDLYMGQKMAIVANASDAVKGYASVSVADLKNAGAHRILLGGERSGTVGNADITAMSDEILWATSLSTDAELISVAKDKVLVADGVTLQNTAAQDETAQTLTLKGKGVALALSDRVNTQLTRDLSDTSINPTALGQLSLGQHVALAGPSVMLDASGQTSLPSDLAFAIYGSDGSIKASTKALSLGGSQMLVGAGTSDTGVLALTPAQLASLSQLERLSLHATSGLTFAGSVSIGALDGNGSPLLKSLTLDAPTVVGQGQAGDSVVLTAQQVNILSSSAASSGATTGQSDLIVVSKPVLNDVQTGGINLSGQQAQRLAFNTVTLDTTGDVVIDGAASTLSTQGDLTIKAARVTGTNQAKKTLQSGGVLTVAAITADRHTLGEQRGAGQTLTLQGTRVVQSGLIDLASGQVSFKASGTNDGTDAVVLSDGSVTNVSGRTTQAGTNWAVSTAGGNVSIQADAGGVALNGQIDVSAGAVTSASDSAKSAGVVSISAAGQGGQLTLGQNAAISGHASTDYLSGRLSVDTLTLAGSSKSNSTSLVDQLARMANSGQMASEFDVRVRNGGLFLNTTLHAQRVYMSADTGSLTLGNHALIDAISPQGGVVSLSARDNVSMARGAIIQADSTAVGANGGDVLLSASQGRVRLSNTAKITAGGDDAGDGRIVLRASIDTAALSADEINPSQLVKVSLPNANGLKAADVTVEAVQAFSADTDADLFKALTSTSSSDAINALIANKVDAFATQSGAVLSALGLDQLSSGQGHVRIGLELRSLGDLTLVNDWNLADLRPGGEPVTLTIRTAGSLSVRGNLSDGFESSGRASASASQQTALLDGAAASFRLVAGADLSAANVMATQSTHISGDLVVGTGNIVRTTSGSIELAAAHDVVLETATVTTDPKTKKVTYTQQGAVYVAGRPVTVPDGAAITSATADGWTTFTEHGGRLEVSAGHDIKSAGLTQLPGNWLLHAGGSTDIGLSGSWWTDFDSFAQGFGSFGGGNVRVTALNNVSNVGVVAPTSSYQIDTPVTSIDADGNPVAVDNFSRVVNNGGNVTVTAGGDVSGGVFVLGRGQGLLKADGAVTAGVALSSTLSKAPATQSTILGLMDGLWTVESRGALQIGAVYNPTILAISERAGEFASYFFTYSASTAVNLSSSSGAVTWNLSEAKNLVGSDTEGNWYNGFAASGNKVTPLDGLSLALIAPPPVNIQAAGGDLSISGDAKSLVLFPSALGNLSLFSSGSVKLSFSTTGMYLALANSSPDTWASVDSAFLAGSGLSLPYEIFAGTDNLASGGLSSTLHQADNTPVRIYAGLDLTMTNVGLRLPKAAEIEAGQDIVNAAVAVEHYDEQDVSLIKAGRDIDMPINLTTKTRSVNYPNSLTVYGPGELRVEAGRDINLNQSDGILARGNAYNPALPDVSAKLSVLAGADKSVVMSDFQRAYLDGDAAAQADLVSYVRQTLNLNASALTGADAYQQALAMYKQMSSEHQVAFADKVMLRRFVATFVASGKPYAAGWQAAAAAANVSLTDYSSNAFLRFKNEVLMAEVKRLGRAATSIADSTDAVENAQRQAARQVLWDELNMAISMAGLGQGFGSKGDINVASSLIQTKSYGDRTQGGIDLYVPGGSAIVGLPANDSLGEGVVTQAGGSIRAILKGDFQVNQQKAFVVGVGDMTIYSYPGAIDSGRGANTSVSAPPSVMKLVNGYPVVVPGATTTGSGLAILPRPDGSSLGDLNLFAPVGGIIALDAYIRNTSTGDSFFAGPIKGDPPVGAKSTAAVAVPSTIGAQVNNPSAATAAGAQDQATDKDALKPKNSVLTVDLLSMGGEASGAGGATAAPDDKAASCQGKDCVKK